MVVTNILLARVAGDLENRVEVLQEHEDSWDDEGKGFPTIPKKRTKNCIARSEERKQ